MDNKISNLAEKIKEKIYDDKKLRIIVIIGLAGILLIFLSEILATNEKSQKNKDMIVVSEEDYKKQIEAELTDILSEISGVGKARVMVTLAGTTEIIFAQEENIKKEESADKYSEDYQNKYVIIDSGGSKEALVRKVMKPEINGVLIVCEGGDSPTVSEKVYKAVSTVLGISSKKICVSKG